MGHQHILFRTFIIVMSIALSFGDNSININKLSDLVYDEQFKQTQHFTNLSHLEEIEGAYPSYIHMNVYGSEEMAVVRRDLTLLQNTGFISGVVALQLMDAFRFGKAPRPPADEIERMVKFYATQHEMNKDYETSLIVFYQQHYDPESGFWRGHPSNIIGGATMLSNLPQSYTPQVLDILLGPEKRPDGVDKLFSPKLVADKFSLVADFDSTSVHLCFGSVLYRLKDTYPDQWAAWRDKNTNLTSIIDALKRYAYRPFSSDRNANTIDSRSYFFMRDFLDAAKRDGKDLAIVPTWAINVDEMRTGVYSITWGDNKICMGVIANFLTGMWSALDSGLLQADLVNQDSDLNLIIDSTASLMVYFLQHNLTGRPDLGLVYYSSVMEFYWFVSKGLLYMENANLRGSLEDVPVYAKYYDELKNVMRSTVTQAILATMNFDQDGAVYFDDYLGGADFDFDGKPINRAEDRYYTTSMAANSLINTWVVYDEGISKPRWIDTVPEEVKATIYASSDWLVKNPFGGKYGTLNAFFNIPEKNRESSPFWYPANRYEYMNGTKIPGFSYFPEELMVFGMEGYVEPQQYQAMLAVDQFGVKTPMDFQGYNAGQGVTPFWSCKSVAYAGAMMTLSMTDALKNSD